jgi:hypothetical protein
MQVTLLGIVTFVKPMDEAKAPSATLVMLEGMM